MRSRHTLATSFVLAVGLIIGCLSESVSAAQINLYLAQDATMDSETSLIKLTPLNLDGLVDLIFIPSGLEFRFINSRGIQQSLRVFFEFEKYPGPNSNDPNVVYIYNHSLDEAKKNGFFLGAEIIKAMSSSAETPLVLYFNPRGKMGMVLVDYEASQVQLKNNLIEPERPSFETVVFETIYRNTSNYFTEMQKQRLLQRQVAVNGEKEISSIDGVAGEVNLESILCSSISL